MQKIIADYKNNQVQVEIEYSTVFASNNFQVPVIKESIFDSKSTKLLCEFSISHSLHSYKRARCRGFSTEDIMSVLEYGELIFKQGLCFYIALKRHLPTFLDGKMIERINNMVVVTNYLGNTLITCYRSKDASAHLRKKTKVLYKYSNCA